MKKIPKQLYKYRKFNEHTLNLIISDMVFYADPSTFNDPLDTNPSIKNDLEESKLTALLVRILEQRSRAELTSTLKRIGMRPSKQRVIDQKVQRSSQYIVDEIDSAASFPDYDEVGPGRETESQRRVAYTAYRIEKELRQQYDKGVVSLATMATCPLMWSHYSDHHRGICIGYSVRDEDVMNLHEVKYGISRLVQASNVSAMLNGDDDARIKVDEAVLLRKAKGWQYENEWRLIGPHGIQNSPFEMKEIIFGMQCDKTVMFAVMKALEGRERPVNIYQICVESGTFNLKKHQLSHDDDHFWGMPRRSLSPSDEFKVISENPDPLSTGVE